MLTFGFLLLSTLCVQSQQLNLPRLKMDAQTVVGIIGSDKAKTMAYCQMRDLGEQIEQSLQEKNPKNDALIQKIDDLEKQLGPEYLALIDALKDMNPHTTEVHAILSMFDKLDDDSCTR